MPPGVPERFPVPLRSCRPPRAAAAVAVLLLAPGGAGRASEGTPPDRFAPHPPVRVVFRFDDFSGRSDLDLEKRILRIFAARDLPLTLGVVPEVAAKSVFDPSPQEGVPLSGEKRDLLREATSTGRVEAALHGLAHQTVRGQGVGRWLPSPLRFHSEFIGAPESVQAGKIARGRRLLEEAIGAPVETFIPPWNAYDEATLRVLEEQRFRTLSAARRGPARLSSSLQFLPRTSDLDRLRQDIETARQSRDRAPVVVVLFHHYDFAEHTGGAPLSLPRLEQLLDWVAGQPDLEVLTIAQAVREMPDLDAGRFSWNRSALLWQITPPWLGRKFHAPMRGIYLDPRTARGGKAVPGLVLAGLYGLLLLIPAAAAGRGAAWIGLRSPGLLRAGTVLSWVGLLGVAGYSVKGGDVYWGGMSAFTFLAGVCGGMSLGLRAARPRGGPETSPDL